MYNSLPLQTVSPDHLQLQKKLLPSRHGPHGFLPGSIRCPKTIPQSTVLKRGYTSEESGNFPPPEVLVQLVWGQRGHVDC